MLYISLHATISPLTGRVLVLVHPVLAAEDVRRSEVSDEEVSTVSTDTDIDVANSDEDSAVIY
jgi:hypothetical protein